MESQAPPALPEAPEKFERLKAVGGATPFLNADSRGQKPTHAEQIGVCRRFYQRFSAFQNAELSNSLIARQNREFANAIGRKT